MYSSRTIRKAASNLLESEILKNTESLQPILAKYNGQGDADNQDHPVSTVAAISRDNLIRMKHDVNTLKKDILSNTTQQEQHPQASTGDNREDEGTKSTSPDEPSEPLIIQNVDKFVKRLKEKYYKDPIVAHASKTK